MPNFHLPFKLALHLKMLVRTLFNQLQALMTKYGSQNATAALISVPSKCPQSSIFAILTPQPQSLEDCGHFEGTLISAAVAVFNICYLNSATTKSCEVLPRRRLCSSRGC